MNEPIKAGDECIVVGGALEGRKHLNHGRIVIVLNTHGPGHSKFGTIWRCRSKDGKPFIRHDPFATQHLELPADQADFAQDWLQKAPKEPPKVQSTEIDKELTA